MMGIKLETPHKKLERLFIVITKGWSNSNLYFESHSNKFRIIYLPFQFKYKQHSFI